MFLRATGSHRRDAASHRIIKQALEGMPSGSHQADAPGIVLPDREKMKTQMEALIYHFKIVTEGFRVPEGEVYQAVESPRGEVGCYMVSDGTQKPYRVHWRGPSFGNLQAHSEVDRRHADRRRDRALGSMDFVLGDTDQRRDNDFFTRTRSALREVSGQSIRADRSGRRSFRC